MISELNKSNLGLYFASAFEQCRSKTLTLLEKIDEARFRCQPHPDFSPAGWHFGHIAYTESLWLLERTFAHQCIFPQYRQLYAADGLPKSERVKLPNIEKTRHYLDLVRAKVLEYLTYSQIDQNEAKIWRFLLQHESQHCETISFVLELISLQEGSTSVSLLPPLPNLQTKSIFPTNSLQSPESANQEHLSENSSLLSNQMIQIPAGEFEIGSDSVNALDNERCSNRVYLDTYYIDRYPVTCKQYRHFLQDGGYQKSQYWSRDGWVWLQSEQVHQPLYWHDDTAWDNHPVCGVSFYEAEAYARYVGKRLPTEAEWEKAARWDVKVNRSRIYPWGEQEPTSELCNCARNIAQTTPVDAYPKGESAYGMVDALGNVWEWTSSWFDAYPGFEHFPYPGYSKVYFDGEHRVLKGASWATFPWTIRASFRNWYHPHVRQILAGFRCAK